MLTQQFVSRDIAQIFDQNPLKDACFIASRKGFIFYENKI